DAGEHGGAVVTETVERPGRDQAFQYPLAHDLRVYATAEILQALEGLFRTLFDDVIHRRLAHALDRGKRVVDAVLADLEVAMRSHDRGQHHLDAEPDGLAA